MGRTRRGLGAALLALALLAAGCTYEDREPGLFGRSPAPEVTVPEEPSPDPPQSVAAIPLVGESVWVTPDEHRLPIRIAVHGVRRVPGGTVLDWSVTALGGPDRARGARVEHGVTLPLQEVRDVVLVDAPGGRIYRPLTAGADRVCLCASVEPALLDLAYDVPELLQVAYPVLPADTRVIDVSVAVAPVFSRVPVAPLGQVTASIADTDLAAAPAPLPVLGRTREFRGSDQQRFAVEIHAVLASGTLTSVVWTLEARSTGSGPPRGLAPELTRNDAWRVRPVVVRATDLDSDDLGCLCSDPVQHSGIDLQEAGDRVTVVTTLGEIPRGTTTVDVLFPDLAPVTGVRVQPASDAAFRAAGAVPTPRETWAPRPGRARSSWPLTSWPTPVPVIAKGRWTATVEPILE